MGAEVLNRFHLKANASFYIREGWLTKGLRHVAENPAVFLDEENAIRTLGIGSAMVKSLRFWMQAAGLTVEPKAGKRLQTLTELGELIHHNDPYFEDDFSLCAVHYHIASNPEMATVWYLLFNCYPAHRFSRDEMVDALQQTLQEMTTKAFASASLKDDCGTALRTYIADHDKQASPEENMQCPLAALNLFVKTSKNTFERTTPPASKLHALSVLYVMLSQMGERDSISLDKLLTEPCNAGKIFHLTSYRLNTYLDELQAGGYLSIQRTAGLNMVYPTPGLTAIGIAQDYYGR